ncbi:ERF family protein [Bradyrhizobium sp. URHD0069]|uniref:ERF family protein n=1 Tax=Bradyrhizobium sp. URHD0069 TaxID=1380355 RepID=UPI000495E14A|nr:ERF family protein [Bradyrhizobium sp. URHD0069]
MHRSSESVAAIATALAKAQTELSNPEKAMVGTVYNVRSDSPQSFRYASLSSGLDIIRKTLGGQQIAIAQTTDIDRANGMVNLTTTLLHTSGEWISSDWPVCQLSETSAPRRMGAALTYARRYALFTMVGIAGEDDVDAPDLTNDQPLGDKAADARLAPGSGAEPAPARSSRFRTGNPGIPLSLEKLGVEESAATRAQLIREIETLLEDDLQPRAIAILKAKNRLSADDAKLVEDAFAGRMALQGALPDALTTVTDLTPLQPPPAPTDAVKPLRPKRRPRKVKAAPEQSAAPPVPSKPTIDDNPSASADATPAKIQKSELTISEPRRHRDKAHLKFVASQPCLVCGRSPTDAHHLRFTQPRAMGRKVSDEFTVPLCRAHHRENHRFGDEQAWWSKQAIDPVGTSRELWVSTRRIE